MLWEEIEQAERHEYRFHGKTTIFWLLFQVSVYQESETGKKIYFFFIGMVRHKFRFTVETLLKNMKRVSIERL